MNSRDALGILSGDQRLILKQFRDTIQDLLQPHHDDYFLLRWLKARDFDLKKSEKMIRESFKFRKKFNIDEILTGKYVLPMVYQIYRITSPLGFDKEGSLVRYVMGGLCDFKGYAYSLHPVELLKLISYILECDTKALADHNKKTGSHEMRSIFIVDFHGFNLRQFYDKHVLHMAVQTLGIYQDNYPENLKVAYLVNVPAYFNWVWNMLKPFVNAATLSKIKIYGADSLSWKEELLDMVDPKILPAFLGGVRCDPDGDPRCQTLVKWQGKIPTSFYLKDKCVLRSDDPDIKSVTVRERACFEHRIPIEMPGTTIRWLFQTKDYNIRFGVLYEKSDSVNIPNSIPDELITVENVECHVIPESGEIVCEKSGQYILHFNNKYSWMTAKQLMYKVTVEPPVQTNTDIN